MGGPTIKVIVYWSLYWNPSPLFMVTTIWLILVENPEWPRVPQIGTVVVWYRNVMQQV